MKIELKDDPLMPHLVEIASQVESRGTILMGGFGLRLKREHLRLSDKRTLIAPIPETRATQDLDFSLSLRFWVEDDMAGAKAYKEMLTRINYEINQYIWQFRKIIDKKSERKIIIDLHSRSPVSDEIGKVKVNDKPKQVGRKMGVGITGRETPEAFAVERNPLDLTVAYNGVEGVMSVPHPYAWLNLKVRAAYDWLREMHGDSEVDSKQNEETGEYYRLKHVYDVYALVAMLTEQERDRASQLADEFGEMPIAQDIRREADELFGKPGAEGIRGIEDYARRSFA